MTGKDRWHELLDGIQHSNLTPADKHVFRFLLDKANYVTAEMPPEFTPTRQTIRRKTSLSYSQIGYSTRHLERHGWLATTGKTAPGKTLVYTLMAGQLCDCTGRVHVPERCQPDAATVPTDGGRSLPTNAANAAGQNGRQTGGMRGVTREEWVNGQSQQPDPPWADPSWPRHGDGRKLSFAEIMAASGSDPWR